MFRQLEKEAFGSPATRARHPILGAKLNFLSLFHEAERQKRAFLYFLFKLNIFLNSKKLTMNDTIKAVNINCMKLIEKRLSLSFRNGR